MKLIQEDLWAHPADLFVVTTNGVLNKSKQLVMGKGAALEAANRFPGIRDLAGAEILRHKYPSVPMFGELIYIYGFLGFQALKIGLFQTKFHWRGPSDLELIGASASILDKFIKATGAHSVRMNYPGINNGGLSKEDVLPVIEQLPDSVTVVYS
jgi:hypothetical protein